MRFDRRTQKAVFHLKSSTLSSPSSTQLEACRPQSPGTTSHSSTQPLQVTPTTHYFRFVSVIIMAHILSFSSVLFKCVVSCNFFLFYIYLFICSCSFMSFSLVNNLLFVILCYSPLQVKFLHLFCLWKGSLCFIFICTEVYCFDLFHCVLHSAGSLQPTK